jgi:hypothetical protein
VKERDAVPVASKYVFRDEHISVLDEVAVVEYLDRD